MNITRIIKDVPGNYFLFGPRGTGKSTWLKESIRNEVYIDLLDDVTYREYVSRPGRLGDVCKHAGAGTVIIDEVQRVPALLPVVHQMIEANKNLRFILTGSSARKLRRATDTDLLGGRAALRRMHPFMACELGDGFDLNEAVEKGTLPLVRFAENPKAALDGYINLYLRQEILAEGVSRNVGAFSRFLEAMSFSQGSLLNLSHVARECAVKRSTASLYIDMVEDLLIGFRIDVFSRRAKRRLADHSKFYFFDCGVYHSVRPRGPLDTRQEIAGAALETLVASHLRAWADYTGMGHSLSFWRTQTGLEVDFVVYGQDCFHAIEVKASPAVHPKDLHGLTAFRDDYPEAAVTLLYNGKEAMEKNGIPCIPVELFLKRLRPGIPFSAHSIDKI